LSGITGARPLPAGVLSGVVCAAAAGLCWGLIFLVPLILPGYSGAALAAGRYTAFGLVALGLAWSARRGLRTLQRADWLAAVWLAAIGNLLYYSCLASAVQWAGAPLPTVIIGTLPVSIALTANLHRRELRWARLLPSLLAIAVGIALVGHHELQSTSALPATGSTVPHDTTGASLLVGSLLALVAVACWTGYAIGNARWMKAHPRVSASTWTTAQGLVTLPMALVLWVALDAGLVDAGRSIPQASGTSHDWLGPTPVQFVLWMAVLGLFASWIGTVLWSQASRRLPVPLLGQLVVFETLCGLAYGFLWRAQWPTPDVAAGITLLVAGVVMAVRAVHRHHG